MLKKFLLNLLFPIYCLGCRREGNWLCAACFKKIKFNDTTEGLKKYNLIDTDLTKIFIAGDYDDPLLANLIKKFKYHFITALGPILARWLGLYWSGRLAANELENKSENEFKPNLVKQDAINHKINQFQQTADFIVIPVPLSKKRARWRGFNQAEILARELGAHFGYHFDNRLRRVKHRPPQASLGEKDRSENIKGVFHWSGAKPNEKTDLNGQTVILIDDLVTTGATLNEAARVLRLAGAARIYGLVLAKG